MRERRKVEDWLRVDGVRFADDTVLISDLGEKLMLLSIFGLVCKRRKMKINVKKE